MKKLLFVLILALAQSAPAFARHVVIHHWKIVDRLQNGTFCFQGDDAKWYYYTLGSGPYAFVPSDQPDIFLLPQGGTWQASDAGPQPSVIQEEEKAIIQFDAQGAPADGQIPPVDEPDQSN
jgi:hypothetical protein